jgi:fructose-1,6-bisphosphatase/inositol monophosphatase family enzyme
MAQGAIAADDADVYLSFATELADLVRPIVLSHFRTPLDVVAKSDHSPVTIVDRAVELRLREKIEACFPDHGIIGEEFGPSGVAHSRGLLTRSMAPRASSPVSLVWHADRAGL